MPALKFTVQGLQQATAAQERIRRGLAAQDQEVKKVTLSTAELGRISTKVSRDTESAQQRLIRKLDELRQAYINGSVSVNEYKKAQQNLHSQFTKNTGEFKKFGDQNERAFSSSVISRVGQYALGLASVATAQRVITRELTAQQALSDRAAAAAVTVSQGQTKVGFNLPGRSRTEVRDAINQGTLLAAELGIQEQFIQNAFSQVLSGTSGNVPLSLQTVKSAATFLGDRPEEIGSFGQTVANLPKVTGSQDPLVNQGFLSFIGARSPITEQEFVARNVGPSLISQVAGGGGNVSGTEAAALFVAFANSLQDTVGKITGTRAVGAQKNILEFQGGLASSQQALDAAAAAAVSSVGDPGSGGFASEESIAAIRAAQADVARRQGIAARLKGKSLSERINIIRQEGIGAEVGTEGVGQKAEAVFQNLLGVGVDKSGIFAGFQAELGAIPGEAGLRSAAQAQIDNLVVTPVQVAARRQRLIAAKAQQVDLGAGLSGLSAEELEGIANIQQVGGFSATTTTAQQFLRSLAGSATLETQISDINTAIGLGVAAGSGQFTPEEQTVLADLLKFLKGLQEESNSIQKEIRDELKSGEGGFKAGPE